MVDGFLFLFISHVFKLSAGRNHLLNFFLCFLLCSIAPWIWRVSFKIVLKTNVKRYTFLSENFFSLFLSLRVCVYLLCLSFPLSHAHTCAHTCIHTLLLETEGGRNMMPLTNALRWTAIIITANFHWGLLMCQIPCEALCLWSPKPQKNSMKWVLIFSRFFRYNTEGQGDWISCPVSPLVAERADVGA